MVELLSHLLLDTLPGVILYTPFTGLNVDMGMSGQPPG